MNKLRLVYDRVHILNKDIQIVEEEDNLRLILRGIIQDIEYVKAFELIDNNIVIIDTNERRYIISNSGEIIASWEMMTDSDAVNIGKFIDSLDIEYIIKNLYTDKELLDINIPFKSYSSNFKLELQETIIDNIKLLSLKDLFTNHNINSLIYNGMRENKFIEDNGGTSIVIINKELRYKKIYNTDDRVINSGIFNKNTLMVPSYRYEIINKDLVLTSVILKRTKKYIDWYTVIYKNKLWNNTYFNLVHIEGNILYLRNSTNNKISLYDINTLQEIENISDIDCSGDRFLIKLTYKINGEEQIEEFKPLLYGEP